MGLAELAEEALSGSEGEEDMDKRVEAALACPCISELREGPCGATFATAFACFIRSEHPDKGMDCLTQFKAFQDCLGAHPEHLEAIMAEEEAAAEAALAGEAAEAGAAAGAKSSSGSGAVASQG